MGMGVRFEGRLASPEGISFMKSKTFVKTGKHNNVLVRLDLYGEGAIKHNVIKETVAETNAQKKERENAESTGGLRDPCRTVAR